MSAKIVAEDGLLKGLVLTLDKGEEWIIGRDSHSVNLVIEDPAASRRQMICRKLDDKFEIENLSDHTAIYLNGNEIQGKTFVNNGDTIQFGNTTYRFYQDSKAQIISEESQNEYSNEENDEEPHYSIYDDEEPIDHSLSEVNFDITDTGRWLLKVIGGPNNGAEFSMQNGHSYVIGTNPNHCDIVFHDTSISRQHVKITIKDDDTIQIEDLKSRNGTLVDGNALTEPQTLIPNSIVNIGTTSFVIYDREGEMQTLISPLMPSIVKILQEEEQKPLQEAQVPTTPSFEQAASAPDSETMPEVSEPIVTPPPPSSSSFFIVASVIGLFILTGLGTTFLFYNEPVPITQQYDTEEALKNVLAPYPDIRHSFNSGTGRLILVGHVLTSSQRHQLLYALQSLNFIKTVDDSGVIIDEGVWSEINQIISKNPSWRGVSVSASAPGKFVISGSLPSRAQAEQVLEYISTHFSYLSNIENRIVVEQDVVEAFNVALLNNGFRNIKVEINEGNISLSGTIPNGTLEQFNKVVEQLKGSTHVRNIRSFVTEGAPEATLVNITDRYNVSGVSTIGSKTSVIINGRILTVGDILDGMTIREITPSYIMLERDNVTYRIDYSR